MPGPHTAFDRAASRVLDEEGDNDHWIVFVSSGKGAGQYRVVTGAERRPDRIVLKIERRWRVVPDRSSRVTLTTAFRRNIIVGNTIDAGFIDPRSKVAGILFWYNAFENVIAENTLRNVGYGVGLTSGFRHPTGWNLVRENVMEQMGGLAVESAQPTFYFDSCGAAGGPEGPLFQPDSDVAGWYAVGNVARANRGRGSPVAAFLHARLNEAQSEQLPEQEEAGVVIPVLENSRFTEVERGIVINRGTVWPVIRGKIVETTEPSVPEIFDQSRPPRRRTVPRRVRMPEDSPQPGGDSDKQGASGKRFERCQAAPAESGHGGPATARRPLRPRSGATRPPRASSRSRVRSPRAVRLPRSRCRGRSPATYPFSVVGQFMQAGEVFYLR